MQVKINIRSATLADSILLAELGARTFRDTFAPENTPENMNAYLAASFSPAKQAAELEQRGSVFLIAEVEGVAVGYARLREAEYPSCITGQRPIELVRLYADKEWIGRGVGARLMTACLAEAEKRDCDTLWLDVWERNVRALAFYRKWGLQPVGTQVFQLGDDPQHDLLMQRAVKSKPDKKG